jgi:hypothetical protein
VGSVVEPRWADRVASPQTACPAHQPEAQAHWKL